MLCIVAYAAQHQFNGNAVQGCFMLQQAKVSIYSENLYEIKMSNTGMRSNAQCQKAHRGLYSKGTCLSDFYTELEMGAQPTAQQDPSQCQAYWGHQSVINSSNH